MAAGVAAQEGEFLAQLAPVIQDLRLGVSAGADRAFPVDERGAEDRFGRTTLRASARTQPWRDADDEVQLNAAATRVDLDGAVVLPETGPLPEELWDLRVGGLYRHVDRGRVLGIGLSVGSSSDEPFHSRDDLTVTASAFARWPAGGDDAWFAALYYSDRSPVLGGVPVPGGGYLWQRGTLRVLAGIPVSGVWWRPDPTWSAEAIVSGLGSAFAAVGVRPLPSTAPPLRVRTVLAWGGDVYHRHDAESRDTRIIFRELRALLAAGVELGPGRSLEAYGGWALARAVAEGRSLFEEENRVRLDPGPVAGVSGTWWF